MNHGHLSPEEAAGLLLLKNRIATQGVPASKLDETLLLATWNIRELGKKARLDASLHYLAEVIGQFDLVCLVEVRDDVSDLSKIQQYLGPYWKVVFSDYIIDPGGNRERVAFLYDGRACSFTGLAGNIFNARTKTGDEYFDTISWWRPPYMASFRAGDFDFLLVGAHIRWGSGEAARDLELRKLASWVADREKEKFIFDKDLILLGDFNIPSTKSSLYKTITEFGLKAPKATLGISHGSNLAKNKRYDQILVAPHFPDSFTGKGGVLDVFDGAWGPLYAGISTKTEDELTFQMSDHLPLWIEINTDDDAFKLEQIVNAKG